jgi:hypothetical protein
MATSQIQNQIQPVGLAPNLICNSPLDRTSHKARVVGDALVSAGVALFDMAAEGRGAAQLDRAHRAPLRTTESTGVALPVLRPTAAEDVRHRKCRTHDRVQK